MVTTESLWETTNALSNNTIANNRQLPIPQYGVPNTPIPAMTPSAKLHWPLFIHEYDFPVLDLCAEIVNSLVKPTNNRTRGHNLKLIKQTCSVVSLNITLQIGQCLGLISSQCHIVSSRTLSIFQMTVAKT